MESKLKALASFLRTAGFEDEAEEVEEQARKSKRMSIKVDPLTLAVSLGLINPSVLEGLDELGHEEDLSEFDQLLNDIQTEKENSEPEIP